MGVARGRAVPAATGRHLIVGGGIVGCSAAWQLARQGLQVVLFEKGRIAGEQSGRNWSRALPRMVTGGASAAALAPLRLSRFFDGSPIVPGPTI
jgi:glycine/D-amino acid oxidase-like deaminating enzyme